MKTDEIQFRFGEEKDAEEFLEDEWKKQYKEYGLDWNPKKSFLCAYDKDKIVGCVKFNILGGIGHLKDIIVAKDYRSNNIGSQLLNMFEEYCTEMDCHMLTLETCPDLHGDAFRIYQNKGYVVQAEIINGVLNKDWVIMVKSLK